MLEFGVDECTIVLQLTPENRSLCATRDWRDIAESIIYWFSTKAELIRIFGERQTEKKPPQGYTIAYKYGEHVFYFAVAYHEYQMSMGVVIKFSAQSLDFYCDVGKCKVYEFLQKVQDDMYSIRLSRVDLTADYIDEDINVTSIYQDLRDNKVAVFREYESKKTHEICYKKVIMQVQGYARGRDVPTVYLGSIQSNSRLRIYDKRLEQLEQKGTKLDKAKQCRNWVRFEGVFRHEFSHQITDELLKIKSDDELANLICSTLAQKFRLMYVDNGVVDCDTEYTQMLIDCITNGSFVLRAPSSRNYELAKNLSYLFNGSGIVSTLYKIKTVWGDQAVIDTLEYLAGYVGGWTPNDDCDRWLRVHTEDYKKAYPEYMPFFRTSILQAIS